MIDEKKLIDKLRDWIRTDYFEDWSAKNFILDDVINEINKMPKVGEWIPANERLPEDGELCIVSAAQNSIVMTCPYSEINFKQYGVTAWQQLPKPYREVKE